MVTTMPQLDTVTQADALDFLRTLPDESIDMVWIDPPYGNSNGVNDLAASRARDKVKGGRQAGAITPIANDATEDWQALMPPVLIEINRILKMEACCCCCIAGGGPGVLFAQLVGWIDQYHIFDQAVVWDKSARGDGMGWRYRRNYEFVMVSHKRGGKLAWNEDRSARPNVIRAMPTRNEYHPTEKPLALVDEFILNHTRPGNVVVDCFAGSGTTGVSAQRLGRHYLLNELKAIYIPVIQKRLSAYTPDLFACADRPDDGQAEAVHDAP